MPIVELDANSVLPFRQQAIAAGVYEAEIEDLLWDNLEELTGDNLFRIARRPVLPLGRPDVIALDADGRVVVIEVKRDVDRNQLAQALEYAGWARGIGLDELAKRYHGGAQAFWDDARAAAPRAVSAPPAAAPVPAVAAIQGHDFRDVTLAEVAEHVVTPAGLVWHRPRRGETHRATLLAGDRIRLEDGGEFASPSGAAVAAADVVSYDGWYAWRLATDNRTLNDLRRQIAGGDEPAEADLFTDALQGPIVESPA